MRRGLPEADPVAIAAFRAALDDLADLERRLDRLHAERARLVERVGELGAACFVPEEPTTKASEFAHRSMRAEIALAIRASEYATDRLLEESSALVQDTPDVLEAVEDGRVSFRAAREIASRARELPAACREAFGLAALEMAAFAAPSRLRTRLTTLRDRIHEAPPEERHAAAYRQRRVAVEDVDDGMSWLHAHVPSVEAHAIFHRLTDVARASIDFDGEEGIDDPRTLDERRADLLVDFIVGDHVRVVGRDGLAADEAFERRVADGRDFSRFAGIRPTVIVTVPVQTLIDSPVADEALGSSDPPILDGTVPIDPVTARRLAANAPSLLRLLVHPHTGVRLDLGRERYQVSTELRMWLRLRDETCRFPGCARLAKGCDVDHTVAWQHGGETRADNLAHLCRGHHTLKHQTRWAVEQHPDGTITWRSPSGRVHSVRPASAFARAG